MSDQTSVQLATELDDMIEAMVVYAHTQNNVSGLRTLRALMYSWLEAPFDQWTEAAKNCIAANERNAQR